MGLFTLNLSGGGAAGFPAASGRPPVARNAQSLNTVPEQEMLGLAAPRPAMLTSLIEQEVVGEHRNLFCPNYDECLDLALGQRWPSWTCAHCPFFSLRHEAEALVRIAGSRNAEGSEASLDL